MSHFCFHDHKKDLILKARPRRKVTRTYKRVEALSKQMSNAVQVNFVKGIKTFKSKISDRKLFEAWKQGSYGHLMETMPWDELPTEIDRVIDPLEKTAYQSSLISTKALPAPVRSGLRYDVKNPSIKRYLNKRAASLVTDITSDTQTLIQRSVYRTFTQALHPDDVARQIKGSIGLLPRHALAVENYRGALTKQGFAPDRIDKLAGAYENRLLNYRAMMIGRTETRFAANYGQLAIWKEAADQDLIDARTTKKSWVTDGDPCEICDPMDGIAVPLDGMWTLNTGDMVEIPTESHPHCMCGMELEYGDGTTADDGDDDE